ncbi:MAG: hypothetical protein CFE45_07900 [Burkholderiales bacterium PBB5]|nr:MAG: hypothetical protein CFE45_07900 [Burkholderiales bacterium PBB5]
MAEATAQAPRPARQAGPTFVTPELSVYLDLVRMLAAFAVLVGHLDQDGIHTRWLGIGQLSHESVVVFFVLSGLVIAHTTAPGRRDWRSYTSARLARIYSVVLPAIVLSFVVKGVAVWLDPAALATEFARDDLRWINLAGALLFLSESWGLPAALPWNGPYWSLCYEVWYYVLFGLAVFVPARWRVWAVGAAALVAGPAILLLGPLWALGAWLARSRCGFAWSRSAGLAVWALTIVCMAGLYGTELSQHVQRWQYQHVPGFWRLQSSQRWLTDYAWGVLVAANFIGFRAMAAWAVPLMAVLRAPVQWLAGFSFSLYLYHRPLTEFVGHFWPHRAGSPWVSLAWLLAVLVAVWALASVTEAQRGRVRKAADRLVGRSAGR